MVSPQCAQAALRIIEGEGYALALPAKNLNEMQRRALIRFGREVELVAPRTKVRVELQWRVADNPILLSGIDAHAVTQTVKLSEDGQSSHFGAGRPVRLSVRARCAPFVVRG